LPVVRLRHHLGLESQLFFFFSTLALQFCSDGLFFLKVPVGCSESGRVVETDPGFDVLVLRVGFESGREGALLDVFVLFVLDLLHLAVYLFYFARLHHVLLQ